MVGATDSDGVGASVGDAVVMQTVHPLPARLPSDRQVKLNPADMATPDRSREAPLAHVPPQLQ